MEICESMYNFVLYHGNTTGGSRKSEMWGRYLFPYIIAYALLFVLLGNYIFRKDRFRNSIYQAVLLVLLILTVPGAVREARDYAKDGEWIREYFQCILE